MEKYTYKTGKEIVEVLDKTLVPKGIDFETTTFEIDNSAIINQEIEILDKQNTREISEYLTEYLEKEKMRGIPVPAEVHLKYNEMIKNFHIKKAEIVEKYKIK